MVDAGEIEIEVTAGFVPEVTPVAERATRVGAELALLIRATLPIIVPTEGGLNATENVFAEPGARVTGRLRPSVLKPLPVTVTW